jgi:tetratricopeptide (TPR) repeat protein
LGQLDEALKHYEFAVKKDPLNGNYYHNRAQVKARLDKLEEAIEDYNKALEYLTETNHKY